MDILMKVAIPELDMYMMAEIAGLDKQVTEFEGLFEGTLVE